MFRESLTYRERAVAADPADLFARGSLAFCLVQLSDVSRELKDQRAATTHIGRARTAFVFLLTVNINVLALGMTRSRSDAPHDTTRTRRGRPRVSLLTRTEQFREAKRRQRERDRQRGLATVHLRIDARRGLLLRRVLADPRGRAKLFALLERSVTARALQARAPLVNVARYPQLRLLAWSRETNAVIDESEALSLYEANWRFIDRDHLTPRETALIRRLVSVYGSGVLDARGESGVD